MPEALFISGESSPSTVPASLAPGQQALLQDMEYIGYVASHDLLAPVRQIAASCGLLKDQCPPGTVDAVQSIEGNAARLNAMLRGLQEYVRIDSFPVRHAPLDANELVQAAMDSLVEEIRASGAAVTHEGLPVVMGHRGRLSRLFACLIENAIKFHGGKTPQLRISARRQGAMWEFSVEDNGIGIEEDYYDIVFRLFQRLHAEGTYPGHGIGLALARKIVASHGGTMQVTSVPGEGSRFYFTLPAAQPI
ncbi:MAG: hypothetical protein KGJ06_00305 [Pseudomonadota bacterium]|nr:hypothetical protein [Pseudomonadota bacterium]